MHRAAAGPELEAAHVARRRPRHGDHEVAEDVGAILAQRVLRKRHDQVGLAELPACAEARQRRQVRRVALDESSLRPAIDGRDRVVAQPAFAREVAEPGVGFPRRHVAAGGGGGDLRAVAPRVLVGKQAEGGGAVLPMARCALPVEDRRDIAREGDRRVGGLLRVYPRGGQACQQEHDERHHPLHGFGYACAGRQSITSRRLTTAPRRAYFRHLNFS